MRRPIRLALSVGALQMVYLAVAFAVWNLVRYHGSATGIATAVISIIVILIAWIANPILCAYTANQLLIGKKIVIAVGVFFLYFVTAPVFKYVSYLAWMHGSGYYAYLLIPNQKTMNFETFAANVVVNVIGVFVVMVEFVVAFYIFSIVSRAESKKGALDL
ncbi:hypothetical protein [Alicyclobacillus sp. ALC3]|uniref:hypothetical protein n=1 Tax=Alicyclobacillus sp. ALC3 TaxID=2796143 RepID=UPI002378AF13|nr:hypothetical protein [Alicyclobacillus sp. ALC3]WDL98784.1 hypothetical protein JC200_09075 [Alicyclobacillus sp. ALC3]